MRAFLKAAKEYKAGISDLPLSDQEKLQILARNARASNPAIQTRAVLAHAQLEREQNTPTEKSTTDILDEFREIGALHTDLMAAVVTSFATPYGSQAHIEMVRRLPPEVMARAAKHRETIAKDWISDNAAAAKALAEFWLRPSSNVIPINQLNGGTTQ